MSYERTNEHKRKMSEATTAAWTDERRKDLSEKTKAGGNSFWKHSQTEESNQKRRESMTGENNHFFGKTHSPETVDLISQKLTGKSKGSGPRLARYGVSQEDYERQIAAGNRWCCYRKHFAAVSEFDPGVLKRKKTGGVCGECEIVYRRNYMLVKRYGVGADWYDAKLVEQNGGCAICKTSLALANKRFLAIDHDHATEQVRGILCARCNLSLARFEIVPDWAALATAYLLSYGTKPA